MTSTAGRTVSIREARLIEALEFYADPWAWKKLHDQQDLIRVPDFYSELSFGGAAVDALAATKIAGAA